MSKKHSRASEAPSPSHPAAPPEIDYSPKVYTTRQLIMFGVKVCIVIGICALLLWLVD